MPEIRGIVDIAADVRFGECCVVWSFVVIGRGTSLGAGCVVGSHTYIGRNVLIGDDVRIQSHVFIPNGALIGNGVFIGPGVVMTDDKFPRVNNPGYQAAPPTIDDGASVGAGAVLLPGIHIGQGALIGAGAVVSRDVPPHTIIRGEPSRFSQLRRHYADTPS